MPLPQFSIYVSLPVQINICFFPITNNSVQLILLFVLFLLFYFINVQLQAYPAQGDMADWTMDFCEIQV